MEKIATYKGEDFSLRNPYRPPIYGWAADPGRIRDHDAVCYANSARANFKAFAQGRKALHGKKVENDMKTES